MGPSAHYPPGPAPCRNREPAYSARKTAGTGPISRGRFFDHPRIYEESEWNHGVVLFFSRQRACALVQHAARGAHTRGAGPQLSHGAGHATQTHGIPCSLHALVYSRATQLGLDVEVASCHVYTAAIPSFGVSWGLRGNHRNQRQLFHASRAAPRHTAASEYYLAVPTYSSATVYVRI